MRMQERIAAMTARRIKEHREARQLTQAEFAELLGCSPRTAFTLETGGRPVTAAECAYLEELERELQPAEAK